MARGNFGIFRRNGTLTGKDVRIFSSTALYIIMDWTWMMRALPLFESLLARLDDVNQQVVIN